MLKKKNGSVHGFILVAATLVSLLVLIETFGHGLVVFIQGWGKVNIAGSFTF